MSFIYSSERKKKSKDKSMIVHCKTGFAAFWSGID